MSVTSMVVKRPRMGVSLATTSVLRRAATAATTVDAAEVTRGV
jgi:hypothetical protein